MVMPTPTPPDAIATSARSDRPLRMIVLAGRDKHAADPLAQGSGLSHKCLVPLARRPLVAHILQTAAVHPCVESLAVSVEREAFDGLFDVLSQLPGRGIVKLVEARENLVDSVTAAAEGWDGALLVTTADHALLTAQSVETMVAALDHADVAFALAPRDAVLAVDPCHVSPFHEFADGAFASCNIYAAGSTESLRAAEVFRGGGRFAGNAWRVLRAFGPVAMTLMAFRAITLQQAAQRLSKRLDLRVAPVVLDDGSQAIDVDDAVTHALAQALIRSRDDGDLAKAAGRMDATRIGAGR